MEKEATFGAGCFWGVEAAFRQLEGVTRTRVGYTGGTLDNPTYEDVCSHTTGHAEVVEVTYDPERISYDELLKVFWGKHDPTQLNRRAGTSGTSIDPSCSSTTGAAGGSAAVEGARAGALVGADRDADRAGRDVLRGRGLPPAVPREARPLELYAGAGPRQLSNLPVLRERPRSFDCGRSRCSSTTDAARFAA